MSAFPATLFAGRRFAVVGLGRNGIPAASALVSMGAAVTCWDDGAAGRDAASAAGLTVAPIANVRGVEALVLSPGIAHRGARAHPLANDAAARGVPVLSDARLLFDAVRAAGSHARFVGITGTNGKSTTTVLLRDLLRGSGTDAVAGGNLGPAALALPLLDDAGVYVLEMSSYMLERVPGLRFDAAALLNVSPDHLERHGDMASYVAAKRLIFADRAPGAVAVVGVDDAASEAVARSIALPVTISGLDCDADWHVRATSLLHDGRMIADLSRCAALPGAHNAQNAAAACALAVSLGVATERLADSLEGFQGLAHRQKRVGTIDGIAFVDDSKATNADAAARALGCTERCIWIAGGLAKEGGIEALGPLLDGVAEALLIGRDAALFAGTLARHGVAHSIVGTLEDAVPIGLERARALGVRTVLLSPAAASFDQFSDFEARGRRFAELVGVLREQSRSAA